MSTFDNVSFSNKNVTCWKESIFGQNGKCIALLFDQKWAHLKMYHIAIKISQFGKSQFWPKRQKRKPLLSRLY